jgi:hypothetical protein
MKRVILFVFLLLMSGCIGNVQKKEETKKREEVKKEPKKEEIVVPKYSKEELELKQYFESYLGYLSTLDTDGVISMTYPNLFIPINKTVFAQYLNTLLNSPHISIQSFDTNITDIGEIQEFNGGKFAKLKYRAKIELAFTNPTLYNDDLSIRVLENVLQKKYGKENIKIDAQNRTITIYDNENLLAIKEDKIGEWKFLGANSEYKRLYPEILPPDMLSQI